ncbi:uroporphyrinogen-III C-methyltransferase [Ruania halotolerans]|uniref:uroporphyrinogen-III C-methyltransferase n=1 Tax=Ruania halotolerans TaxID=2897773 RepID=UPI001E43E178|nr:uroporphyrinogen-III C-methyltransferase [Ruania halotolerans]UFU05283.1 uroporphyrinogen-III C-methyltransferase [Ruania halotolerans]
MTSMFGLDLAGRTVLIAGGGPVAARRAQALFDDGARLRVVAPYVCEDLADLLLIAPDRTDWFEREVVRADLEGAWLVLAATDSVQANAEVAGWAEQARIFCINAGSADQGTARTPATTRSGDLLVGVVTDVSRSAAGADPRRVAGVRDQIGDLLRAGVDQRRQRPASGQVTLVGGGPGAVDLLTVRGRRAIAEADVVVTDRLGPVDVLADLAPGVEVINVGKTPGHHPVPQHEINRILVEQAQRGRQVVRLKGGDPFVFGRGGEEVIACREADVPVQVVPGISSALSVPALAGIPLTHRGTSASFHVTSGHDGLDSAALVAVVERSATLVILMGVSKLASITAQALEAGADPATPAAVVERGSTPTERITRSTLGGLADDAQRLEVKAPAIIVIGDVADDERLGPT